MQVSITVHPESPDSPDASAMVEELEAHDPADPGGPYGEVKRMYVRPAYRRRGIGKRVLGRLIAEARGRGVTLLRLETSGATP